MTVDKKKTVKAVNEKEISEKKTVKAKTTKNVKESQDGNTKKTSRVASQAAEEPKVEKKVDSLPIRQAQGRQSTVDGEDKKANKPIAKAGKRSEKSLKEVEEKQAKVERKAQNAEAKAEDEAQPKHQQKPARSKLERKSKKYRKAAELLEKDKSYTIKEAMELATKTSPVKFDATVELHIRLGVDPRQADQNIRDMVALPAGTGKTIRVAVLADPDGVAAAKKAGADIAGSDEFLQELDKGTINFDILVATPAFMPKLGKYARVLGPKGLMPNPKSGTVTNDVAKAVTDAKGGRLEYRVDSTSIIHAGIGKVSFGGAKLLQNAQAIINSVKQNKPASLKGNYIRSIYATTSMGPSIPIATTEL